MQLAVADAPATPCALRPVRPDDAAFLRALYAELRADELDAWAFPATAREAFLDLQFRAWSSAVAFRPEAAIVLADGAPVGLLVVVEGTDGPCLSEIALCAAVRGRGLGTTLIRALQAGRRPITLHVLHGSAAVGLYTRLGFSPTGDDDGLRIGMRWTPGAEPAASDEGAKS